MASYGSINADIQPDKEEEDNALFPTEHLTSSQSGSGEELSALVAASSSFPTHTTAIISTNTQKGSTWYYSVFIVVNAALGAGLLDFPAAYHQAGGVLVAMIVQGVLLLFIVGSLLLLAYCSDLNEAATYQSVVSHMCGRWGRVSCSVLVAIYCFGTCVTFFIIIADQLDRLFAYAYGNSFCHVWYMKRSFTVVTSSVFLILPLCFPKKIDFLKHTSAVGVVTMFYLVIMVVVEFYTNTKLTRGEVRTQPSDWMDIFNVMPVICFGYQCHVSAIPVYSCLSVRRLSHFTGTIAVAIIICFVVYSLTGVYGYLSFGGEVESDVLLSYPSDDTPSIVGRVMMAAKTYTTYPILLFCGRAAVDDLISEWYPSSTSSTPSHLEQRRRVAISLLWFVISLGLAVVIPNISDVISFLGSLAAVFIFVYPGICLLERVFVRDPSTKRLKYKFFVFISFLYIILGVFIFGVVIVQSVQGSLHPGHRRLPPVCST